MKHLLRPGVLILVLGLLFGGLLPPSTDAQPPAKKKVKKQQAPTKKARAVSGDRPGVRRTRPRESYVRTRRDFGHVRVRQRHRHGDVTLDIRPILVRSARVTPVVLHRFEDRRREQIRMIARHFREGRRREALAIWGTFVDDLAGLHEPIDLDEIMLYVAREGCLYENDAFLFHAAKLEFLRESEEHLEDYIDQLYDQRDTCVHSGRCSAENLRDLEIELVGAQADLEILQVKARVASDEFEKAAGASRDYERRFAATFDDMYREVELRIRFSP